MFESLENKTFLVTGASSGIGRAIAIQLSQLGAHVILCARNTSGLEETKRLLEGTRHTVAPIDTAAKVDFNEWMTNLAAHHGSLDGMAHCAGSHTVLPLRFLDEEAIDQQLTLHIKSALLLAKAFRQPSVRAQGRCSLLFVSSIAAIRGFPGWSVYAAGKAGIIGLTKTLACELARENIRVNCLVPGWVDTALTREAAAHLSDVQLEELKSSHLLGLGSPQDVAGPATFLLSSAANWMTGEALVVDGGRTIH